MLFFQTRMEFSLLSIIYFIILPSSSIKNVLIHQLFNTSLSSFGLFTFMITVSGWFWILFCIISIIHVITFNPLILLLFFVSSNSELFFYWYLIYLIFCELEHLGLKSSKFLFKSNRIFLMSIFYFIINIHPIIYLFLILYPIK